MWLKWVPIRKFLRISGAITLLGCGVKGDPLPPEQPLELGRGRPTFDQATQGKTLDPQLGNDEESWRSTFEEEDSGSDSRSKTKLKSNTKSESNTKSKSKE